MAFMMWYLLGLFEGECQIDFGEIYEYLKSFGLVE